MKDSLEHTSLFKQAMGNYPTGVSIVTAMDENNEPIGLTVNSLASVSIDPLLILWSIDQNVSTYHTFTNINTFAINILAGEQTDIAYLFASDALDNKERFEKCEWALSDKNLPVIANAMATFECQTYKRVEIGDHTTLFGEIFNIQVADRAPLLYHQRKIAAFPESFHKPLDNSK